MAPGCFSRLLALTSAILLSSPLLASGLAAPRAKASTNSSDSPIVKLDYGTYQGYTSDGGVDYFLGMAYAQPPVGKLRFAKPLPPAPFKGVHNATAYSSMCAQQNSTTTLTSDLISIPSVNLSSTFVELLSSFSSSTNEQSEDCLYVNVLRPTNTPASAKLPVVVWIYGGGFVTGDASSTDGTPIIQRSLAIGEPIIYVSLNYRLGAFGFLGGREAEAAGSINIGLYDQRLALHWVKHYISQFGGDPNRVTVWGQSAGSMSILSQMLAFGGRDEGLFHAAFMMSGYTQPILSVNEAQFSYDQIVEYTGCSSPSAIAAHGNSTFECLREAPFESIVAAVNSTSGLLSYAGLNLTFGPRVEGPGGFLEDTFRQGVAKGKYVKVPIVAGECADEGTLFSINTTNVTTDASFQQYITTGFGNANQTVQALVANAYSSNVTEGSPYNTGIQNAVTPQYKRVAAFNGDFYFQAPRRSMLATVSKTQKVWSYLWERMEQEIPILGAFHESDLYLEFYLPAILSTTLGLSNDYIGIDALVNFVNNHDPNYNATTSKNALTTSLLQNLTWPQYTTETPLMFTFDDPTNYSITTDDYRGESIALLNKLQIEFGF